VEDVGIRWHTSAYVSIRQADAAGGGCVNAAGGVRWHTSAYVSLRQADAAGGGCVRAAGGSVSYKNVCICTRLLVEHLNGGHRVGGRRCSLMRSLWPSSLVRILTPPT
jgi:hypothetical protein